MVALSYMSVPYRCVAVQLGEKLSCGLEVQVVLLEEELWSKTAVLR